MTRPPRDPQQQRMAVAAFVAVVGCWLIVVPLILTRAIPS